MNVYAIFFDKKDTFISVLNVYICMYKYVCIVILSLIVDFQNSAVRSLPLLGLAIMYRRPLFLIFPSISFIESSSYKLLFPAGVSSKSTSLLELFLGPFAN